jgi:hypothetical protein
MSDQAKPVLTPLNPPERERTYHHANFLGGKLTLKNVTHLLVRPSGTHRLMTSDGHKWIVDPAKGFAIELDVDDWTL